jgi:hypothetical protein
MRWRSSWGKTTMTPKSLNVLSTNIWFLWNLTNTLGALAKLPRWTTRRMRHLCLRMSWCALIWGGWVTSGDNGGGRHIICHINKAQMKGKEQIRLSKTMWYNNINPWLLINWDYLNQKEMHTCIQFGLNSAYRTSCSNNANTNLEVGGNIVKTKKYKGSKW